jgi:hypothetical protein
MTRLRRLIIRVWRSGLLRRLMLRRLARFGRMAVVTQEALGSAAKVALR